MQGARAWFLVQKRPHYVEQPSLFPAVLSASALGAAPTSAAAARSSPHTPGGWSEQQQRPRAATGEWVLLYGQRIRNRSSFPQEHVPMVSSHTKRYSNVTNSWGNKIQTTTGYQLKHLLQNDCYQKTANDKYRQGGGEKSTLLRCWWESKLERSLWKTTRGTQKTKIELL